MQTTGKYNEIFNQPAGPNPVNQGTVKPNNDLASTKMDVNVLAAEIRTIIKKAFEADQLQNSHHS